MTHTEYVRSWRNDPHGKHWRNMRDRIQRLKVPGKVKARLRQIVKHGRRKGLPCILVPEETWWKR